MASRRRSIRVVSLLAPLVLLLGALCALLACYKPNIEDGGFKCNRRRARSACPEGFQCDTDDRSAA